LRMWKILGVDAMGMSTVSRLQHEMLMLW
jgi:hypothetical protein